MSRFDPEPDVDYGKCLNCEEPIPTQEAAHAHLSKTMKSAGRTSHRVSIENPDREQRIEREVDDIMEAAMTDAFDNLYRLVERGELTEEEVKKASWKHSDFADGWEDYCNE